MNKTDRTDDLGFSSDSESEEDNVPGQTTMISDLQDEDRKVTPFNYQREGRLGDQILKHQIADCEDSNKLFKDETFPVDKALFDARITLAILSGDAD